VASNASRALPATHCAIGERHLTTRLWTLVGADRGISRLRSRFIAWLKEADTGGQGPCRRNGSAVIARLAGFTPPLNCQDQFGVAGASGHVSRGEGARDLSGTVIPVRLRRCQGARIALWGWSPAKKP